MVYSFEKPHFKVGPVSAYFARPDVIQRPIVVQVLNCGMLDASSVLDYLRHMVDDNITFGTHNWCSYQVAMALKHGNEKFEPVGIDTPWEVYNRARLGLATRTYFIWDPGKTPGGPRRPVGKPIGRGIGVARQALGARLLRRCSGFGAGRAGLVTRRWTGGENPVQTFDGDRCRTRMTSFH